jgi:hypothetical protein
MGLTPHTTVENNRVSLGIESYDYLLLTIRIGKEFRWWQKIQPPAGKSPARVGLGSDYITIRQKCQINFGQKRTTSRKILQLRLIKAPDFGVIGLVQQ